MHWDSELEEIGVKNIPRFLGVFAADEFPSKRGCFILNTDVAGLPGKHWVAVINLPKKQLFFDSYGRGASFYHNKLWKAFSNFRPSKMRLQSRTSTVCGDWCLLFLFRVVAQRKAVKTFLEVFSNKLSRNDCRVVCQTTKLFDMHRGYKKTKRSGKQCCQAECLV